MIKEPENMDDLLFFTNRRSDNGAIKAWAHRPLCPKCKKGKMGKPVNEKTGKVAKKAEVYACHACHYEMPGSEAEKIAVVDVLFTCPFCRKSGEAKTSYERKLWQGVPAYVFECTFCKQKIGITKKMKAPKKKKAEDIPDDT
jgi:hypothetical protein